MSQISCVVEAHSLEPGLDSNLYDLLGSNDTVPVVLVSMMRPLANREAHVTCQSCRYATISADDLISNTHKYYHQQ
jgi:hypothetical protein